MNSDRQRLTDKVALVTGASRGIGSHLARSLAAAGADVAVNYRQSEQAAAAVVQSIRDGGGEAAAFQGDMTEPAANRRTVQQVVDRFGRLDILVNNVGVFAYKATAKHTPDEFERIIAGTVGTTFHCSLAALPYMRERGWGRIINIGAAGAERAAGRRRVGPHLAGKSAVISLTRTLAKEEGPAGITVNAVCPGVIEDRTLSREEARTRTDDTAPVGRPGTSRDIADAVLYLASPAADFVNGAAIAVTGGWCI